MKFFVQGVQFVSNFFWGVVKLGMRGLKSKFTLQCPLHKNGFRDSRNLIRLMLFPDLADWVPSGLK